MINQQVTEKPRIQLQCTTSEYRLLLRLRQMQNAGAAQMVLIEVNGLVLYPVGKAEALAKQEQQERQT